MHSVEKNPKGDPLIFPVSSQVETSRDTGPSRRHIQGSKIAKGLPSVNLQYSKNQKNGLSGEPGPASASPWRAKRGNTSENVDTSVAVEGRKNKFSKSHNAEKLKAGPFAIFKHPFCCKISKKLKGGPFGEKKF